MPLGSAKKKKKRTKGGPARARAVSPSKPKFEEQEDATINVDSLLEGAFDTLHRLRLKLPQRPTDIHGEVLDPQMPGDLSKCTSEHLGSLNGQFTAMAQYAQAQLALLDTRHVVGKHNEKVIRAVTQLSEKGTVKDREARSMVSGKTQSRAFTHYQRYAEFRLLQNVLEGYIMAQKAISREMTRRQKAAEAGRDNTP